MPHPKILRSRPGSVIAVLSVAACLTGSSLTTCRQDYVPKPRAYYRIDLPEHDYRTFDTGCPYKFEYAATGTIVPVSDRQSETCWYNISYPSLKGNIHLSYKPIDNNLPGLLEDTRTLVYKHTIKAQSISEKLYMDNDRKVYGILYEIGGDAASNIQFFVTDSVNHFLRGALYFATIPNADSLKPVIAHVKKDIIHLMETIEWKAF